jgi:hypothetical protein
MRGFWNFVSGRLLALASGQPPSAPRWGLWKACGVVFQGLRCAPPLAIPVCPVGATAASSDTPPNRQSRIRNPKSEIRNPQSEIRNPQSEIRNPKCLHPSPFRSIPSLRLRGGLSWLRHRVAISIPGALKWPIQNPKSKIQNPVHASPFRRFSSLCLCASVVSHPGWALALRSRFRARPRRQSKIRNRTFPLLPFSLGFGIWPRPAGRRSVSASSVANPSASIAIPRKIFALLFPCPVRV